MNAKESLRSLLLAVFRFPPERAAITSLIRICHGMSVTYLRMKEHAGNGVAARSGLTPEDLAYDAIAELFRRDREGMLPELVMYFERAAPPETSDEDMLFVALRRLVFSATNHQMFRLHREIDPSLGRVIRNIKLTVKRHPLMYCTEHLCEQVLVPIEYNLCHRQHPLMPSELITPLFLEGVSARSTLVEMLTCLADILRAQREYCPAVRVADAALLVRSVFAPPPGDEPAVTPHDGIDREEIMTIIDEVTARLERSAERSYVRTGKIPAELLQAYLNAVRQILEEEFISADGLSSTYCTHLQRHLPGLTAESYRSGHRTIVEYLAKTGKSETRELLRREW